MAALSALMAPPQADDEAPDSDGPLDVEPASLDRLRATLEQFAIARASSRGVGGDALERAESAVLEALDATGAPHDVLERLLAAHRVALAEAEAARAGGERAPGLAELHAITTAIARADESIRGAREALVRAHLRMVVAAARRFTSRGVALADLIQEGNLGLLIAADRFDHTLGYRFNTYAMWWIRAKLRAAVARHGRTIRVPTRRLQKVSRVLIQANLLSHELGREPTADELSARVGLEPDEVRALLDIPAEPLRFEALEAADGAAPDDRLEDKNAESPLSSLISADDRARARALLTVLSPREVEIVRLRFGMVDEPHTLEDIGRRLGVTRERIRQIEARALDKMRGSLQSASTPRLRP